MTLTDAANALGVETGRIVRLFPRAVASAARWAASQAAKEFAKQSALSITGARRRVVRKGNSIWFGGNPVSLKWLNPKASGSGVKFSGGFREGAFILKGKNGQVFKRTGKARLPIVKQTTPLEQVMSSVVDSDLAERAGEKIISELKRMLSYD